MLPKAILHSSREKVRKTLQKMKLDKHQLNLRLTQIDGRLLKQGLPFKYRPLEAFKVVYGTISTGELRDSLFEDVVSWFVEKYGESAKWDGVIGRCPVLIRGNVYLLRIPFTSGDARLKLTDYIEGLPQSVQETFTPQEFEKIGQKAASSTLCFQKLYDLTVEDTFLDEVEKGLVRRGLFDLENAAYTLKHSGDTQTTIFQTHAAAEKFLKVALKRSGSTIDLKSLNHGLRKIHEMLSTLNSRYVWLRSSVDSLQNFAPNMNIRYGVVARSLENAISAFFAALSICAVLAQTWLFDVARGTDHAAFVPGSFYKDGADTTYRCLGLSLTKEKRPGALLRRFGNYPFGSLMFDALLDLDQSALYLEIKDASQIDGLRRLYELHMRNRGKEKTPEEFGIQIASGPEGSYATAFLKTDITPKE
jgi:hypothetical protein